jgi:hypothetical protein
MHQVQANNFVKAMGKPQYKPMPAPNKQSIITPHVSKSE